MPSARRSYSASTDAEPPLQAGARRSRRSRARHIDAGHIDAAHIDPRRTDARRIDARRVGLISDTHGLLREEALRALAGVGLIIHAGDIGGAEIISGLQQVAPVQAVRGNNDRGPWAEAIPEEQNIVVAGVAIHVLHDVKTLRLQQHKVPPRIVIAGHSHKPSITECGGTLYINPGSAGPRRFRLPVTLAFLEFGRTGPGARIEQLL